MIETQQFIQELYRLHDSYKKMTTNQLKLQDRESEEWIRLNLYGQLRDELLVGQHGVLGKFVQEYRLNHPQIQMSKADAADFFQWARTAFRNKDVEFYRQITLALVEEVRKNGGKITE